MGQQVLEFALELQSQNFVVKDKGGTASTYTVTEMNGTQLEAYLNSMKDRVIMDGGKVIGMKKFDGMYTSLLSRTVKDSEGTLVPVAVLNEWPASVQKALFKVAQKLNDLDSDAKESVGNG